MMDIRNSLMDLNESYNTIDDRFRYLWDTLLDYENGLSGESYGALKSLGESICPVFVKMASQYVEETDGEFYITSNIGES